MVDIRKQFDEAWPEIKTEFEKDPHWKKTQGFGAPKYYFQLAEEFKQDLKDVDKEIASIRQIKNNNRNDFEMRSKCEKIIDDLTEEKESIKCTILRFQNFGTRLNKKRKNDGTEENQSSQQK